MNTTHIDTTMMNCFAFLQKNDLNAYINLKKNAEAIYRQRLAATADAEFFSKKEDAFESYSMREENVGILADFVGVQQPFHRLHVLRHKHEPFATVYAVSKSGYITEIIALAEQRKIDDLFSTFRNCLVSRNQLYAEREPATKLHIA